MISNKDLVSSNTYLKQSNIELNQKLNDLTQKVDKLNDEYTILGSRLEESKKDTIKNPPLKIVHSQPAPIANSQIQPKPSQPPYETWYSKVASAQD